MGKIKKEKLKESLILSASTAMSQGDELSIRSLAENISLILDTVKGNTAISWKSNIKAINNNVKRLDEFFSESSKSGAEIEK